MFDITGYVSPPMWCEQLHVAGMYICWYVAAMDGREMWLWMWMWKSYRMIVDVEIKGLGERLRALGERKDAKSCRAGVVPGRSEWGGGGLGAGWRVAALPVTVAGRSN